MRAVSPTGALSRKNAYGASEPPNSWHGHGKFVDELNLYYSASLDDPMPESAQRMSYSAMKKLITKGEQGTLHFRGEDPVENGSVNEADTIKMSGCGHLIELREPFRRNRRARFGQPLRVMRLYYFEPYLGVHVTSETLCGLHIASKPADEADIHEEQNAAIRVASARSMFWFQEKIEESERNASIEKSRQA